MPHIFFERLERRRSTQTLVGYQGFSGSSMGQSYSEYGEWTRTCYAVSIVQPGPYGPDGLFGGMYDAGYGMMYKPQTPSISSPLQTQWQIPNAWNSSNTWQISVPSMDFSNTFRSNYLNMNNRLLSPTAPISNLWQNMTLQTPSFGSPNSYEYGLGQYTPWSGGQGPYCYAFGPFYGTPAYGGISKLEKVRENLIAFFQHKGILSGNQGKRLFFSLFDKA